MLLTTIRMNRTITSFRQIQDHLIDLGPHGPHRPLIVLDIDNTLLRPMSVIGSPEWIKWQEDLISRTKGHHPHCAAPSNSELYKSYHTWMTSTRPQTCILDQEAPTILQNWSNLGYKIILLTARLATLSSITRKQFDNHYHSSILSQDIEVIEGSQVMIQGCYFADGKDKGECLSHILKIYVDDHDYVPDHIVFVDDSERECRNVLKILGKNNLIGSVFQFKPCPSIQLGFDLLDKECLAETWKAFQRKIGNN